MSYGSMDDNPFADAPAPSSPSRASTGPSYLRPSSTSYPSSSSSSLLDDATSSQPSGAPPPRPSESSKKSALQDQRSAALDAREADLDAREAALAAAEAEADRNLHSAQEAQKKAAASVNPRKPNWPPCFPRKLVYINFEEDIPEILRVRVELVFYHLYVTLGLLVLNIACTIGLLWVDGDAFHDLIQACIYAPLILIMDFLVFRQLYKAARLGKSLAYFVFFIGFTIEIIVGVIAVIGAKGSGFGGLIWCIKAFGKDGNKAVGVMCLINFILWGLSTAFCIYTWIHTRVNFHQAGGLEALKRQAAEAAAHGAVNFARENPDLVKKAGTAAVDYAKEHPEQASEAASILV